MIIALVLAAVFVGACTGGGVLLRQTARRLRAEDWWG